MLHEMQAPIDPSDQGEHRNVWGCCPIKPVPPSNPKLNCPVSCGTLQILQCCRAIMSAAKSSPGGMALVFCNAMAHVRSDNVFLCDPLLPFIRLQSISQSDFAGLPHTVGST